MFTKSIKLGLPLLIINLLVNLSAQEGIHITTKSTGQTTGEIAELTATNTSDQAITIELGPFLIPATGKYQGYIIPHKIEVTIPPGDNITVPIRGYCTDISRAPVPAGEPLIDGEKWIEISTSETDILPDPILDPRDYIREWHTRIDENLDPFSPENGFEFYTDPTQLVSIQHLPETIPEPQGNNCCMHPTLPGTDFIIPYKLDFDRFPESGAPLIYKVIREVERTYDSLNTIGEITTPFSGTPVRQKEAVIQQTFWVYTSLIKRDDPYEKEDFEKKMIEQLETSTGQDLEQAPPGVKDNFKDGVDDFWSSFQLVGEKAKILKAGTIETKDPPTGRIQLICPENGSFFNPGEPLMIDWDVEYYSANNENIQTNAIDLNFSFTPETLTESAGQGSFTIEKVNAPGLMSVPRDIPTDVCFNVITTSNSAKLLMPVALNICSNDISLDSLIRLVEEMRKEVEGAQAKLNENSLVKEARLIQMIRELSSSPEGVEDLYDKWLNSSMEKLKEDLTKIENVGDVIKAVKHIEKLLSILEKIDTNRENIAKYQSIRNRCEKLRENWMKPAEDAQEKFNQFYDELISMLEDFKGHVQNKIEEFVSDKINETIQKMLVSKYGPGPAGALMKATEDLKNFIDALIKKGELEEAKVMFHLYYFEMLKRVYEHPKWRVDENYNKHSRIQWANCKEVENKDVTIKAFVKCWQQAKDSQKPGEGNFSSPKPIKFENGQYQLSQQNFRSDCPGECAFRYQLDMEDLKKVAGNCQPAYIEIEASYGGNSVRIFGGTYKP